VRSSRSPRPLQKRLNLISTAVFSQPERNRLAHQPCRLGIDRRCWASPATVLSITFLNFDLRLYSRPATEIASYSPTPLHRHLDGQERVAHSSLILKSVPCTAPHCVSPILGPNGVRTVAWRLRELPRVLTIRISELFPVAP